MSALNLVEGPVIVDSVQYLSGDAVVKVLTFDPPIKLAVGDTLKVALEVVPEAPFLAVEG